MCKFFMIGSGQGMREIVELNPTSLRRMHSANAIDLKALLTEDRDLEALMKRGASGDPGGRDDRALGAGPREREPGRQGYLAGHYGRGLVTRIGKVELWVPRDRNEQFQTALFERYQRSGKAFVTALAKMYVQEVSTRKVGLVPGIRSEALLVSSHPHHSPKAGSPENPRFSMFAM